MGRCGSGPSNKCPTDPSATSRPADSDSVCLDVGSLSHSGRSDLTEGLQFSVWVSFFEIYNEFLYDLLESPTLQARKRGTLRLSDDRHGNPYVKGKPPATRGRSNIQLWNFGKVSEPLLLFFLATQI